MIEKKWTVYNQKRAELRQERINLGLCVSCGLNKKDDSKYCEACLIKNREASKKWYKNQSSSYHRQRDKKYKNTSKAKIARNKYLKRKRAEFKKIILEKYGCACECCKEANPAFLTIDHVNQDGYKDNQNRMKMLRNLAKKPKLDNFRILCYNCNCAREHFNGICPHKLISI